MRYQRNLKRIPHSSTVLIIRTNKNFHFRTPLNRRLLVINAAVIKYGKRGDGRDLTGSPKLLRENRWASNLFQITSLGYELFAYNTLH